MATDKNWIISSRMKYFSLVVETCTQCATKAMLTCVGEDVPIRAEITMTSRAMTALLLMTRRPWKSAVVPMRMKITEGSSCHYPPLNFNTTIVRATCTDTYSAEM